MAIPSFWEWIILSCPVATRIYSTAPVGKKDVIIVPVYMIDIEGPGKRSCSAEGERTRTTVCLGKPFELISSFGGTDAGGSHSSTEYLNRTALHHALDWRRYVVMNSSKFVRLTSNRWDLEARGEVMICFCRIMIKWDKMTDVQDCNNTNLELITRGISTILRMQMSFSLAGYMMISKTKTIHFISSLESIHPIPLHPPNIPRFLLTSNL